MSKTRNLETILADQNFCAFTFKISEIQFFDK